MKKIHYYFIFTILLITGNKVTSQWVDQQFWPEYEKSYFIPGTSTGYTICNEKLIKKTTNGGQTWENNLIGDVSEIFTNVYFINNNTGWTIGYNGEIRYTTNGGAYWDYQSSGVSSVLTAVDFVNPSTGFITTNNGVLKTTNSGSNWNFISVPGNYYESVKFKDANTGMMCGNNNDQVKVTTNGGNNWATYSTGSGIGMGILAYTELSTFYCGGNSKIYKTTNAGINWQISANINPGMITSIEFYNPNTGYACIQTGKIYKTTNAGLNWVIKFDNNNEYDLNTLKLISGSGNDLIAMGGYGIILKSTNSGENWSITSGNSLSAVIESLSFPNNLTGYACDEENLIYKTTNAGTTWQVNNTFEDWVFEKIQFFNSNTGILFARDQSAPLDGNGSLSFLKTTNGGNNWINNNITAFNNYFSSYFVNENTGFECGSSNSDNPSAKTIYKTTNGGLNWVTQFNTTTTVRDIYFTDANTGWGSCDSGKIIKTTNGGANWNTYSTPVTTTLHSLSFPSANTGYTCSDFGKVLKTTNSGINWNIQGVSINDLYDVKFSTDLKGCAVGDNGARFITTNGGANWINHSAIYIETLNAIAFTSPDKFYTAGAYAYIGYLDMTFLNVSEPNETGPTVFKLYQNYPNPFNPVTKIKFSTALSGYADLKIYNIEGKLVKTIFNGNLNKGEHNFSADLSDFSSGVYFYSLTIQTKTGSYKDSKKMILIK